ncbi:SAM-dependent methyltransferase [Oceanibium sediminis]|uniref:SAM-dependent methyltransferase n=1 Tax=Oceanibium sediminis TaxID=2026339 RepID=UPI001E394BC8|nr:cyclopropane-fatty-acyl-phospholipid synthase family protein [Oceanibium sediminis]
MLRGVLRKGALHVVMPDGTSRDYGDGSGPPLTARIHDAATLRRLSLNPELALGEAYMNESLTVDGDDLQGFLAMLLHNVHRSTLQDRVWWQKIILGLRSGLRGVAQNNVLSRARRNVSHHYDLSGELYDLFLDTDRQYSCAYFTDPHETLEQAQADKKAHIARKLLIEPGMRVLDIGCGWGGLALSLARDHCARVVGITLSREQHAYATERAKAEGLSDQVEFRLCDYRNVQGTFDRIVSVGMFEHVGPRHFTQYFRTIRELLSPDGIALVHTIGWTAPPQGTNPWMAKYIFPGGYIPTVSEAMSAVERARLWAADIECWRLHYAYTLHHWYERFEQHADEVRALYDARFVRMWRFYLAASEQTFRHGTQAVFQYQLSREVDAVPLTRDYLYLPPEQAAQHHAGQWRASDPVAGRITAAASRRRSLRETPPRKEALSDRQNPSRR